MQYKTEEEIKEYFKLLRNGNLEYREKIIMNYMDLVSYIVTKKLNLKNAEDYIEEGYIGLIKAVDSFDYKKGIKFTAYASRCIYNEIFMYIRKIKKLKNTCSINEIIHINEDGKNITIEDTLYDTEYDVLNDYFTKQISIENEEKINQIFSMLNDRELKIIKLYYGFNGSPKKQSEIALILGISQPYISRFIKEIEEKIKLIYQIKSLTKHK